MILVTGASGFVGGQVARLLAGRGCPVRVLTGSRPTVAAHGGLETG